MANHSSWTRLAMEGLGRSHRLMCRLLDQGLWRERYRSRVWKLGRGRWECLLWLAVKESKQCHGKEGRLTLSGSISGINWGTIHAFNPSPSSSAKGKLLMISTIAAVLSCVNIKVLYDQLSSAGTSYIFCCMEVTTPKLCPAPRRPQKSSGWECLDTVMMFPSAVTRRADMMLSRTRPCWPWRMPWPPPRRGDIVPMHSQTPVAIFIN